MAGEVPTAEAGDAQAAVGIKRGRVTWLSARRKLRSCEPIKTGLEPRRAAEVDATVVVGAATGAAAATVVVVEVVEEGEAGHLHLLSTPPNKSS